MRPAFVSSMRDSRPLPVDLDVDVSVEACPHCGLRYRDMRTGLTFKEVRNMFWVSSEDSEDWQYKRRGSVLGKWNELKKDMWHDHLLLCASVAYCEESDEYE